MASLLLLAGFALPGSSQQPAPAQEPSYIEKLKEFARLRDEGVITQDDFDRKKAQLLGLSTPESEKDDSAKPRSILAKHCEQMLLSLVKSPSSTRIRNETEFPSPSLSPALKRFLSEGQSVDAPGTTVFIEYDAPNSYGVMLPGKIACDYTNPPFVENDLAFVPRMIMLDSKPVDPLRVKLMGIQGSMEMLEDMIEYSKERKREGEQDSGVSQ